MDDWLLFGVCLPAGRQGIWCLVIVALSNAFVLNKPALLRRRKRDGARRKTPCKRISGYAGGHIG